jgi:NAD(P)-dependent dehydrogenase (short-subunit alcohol dehydrogenase family)
MEASALVTGGASGLGAATAARLAAEGLAVTRLDRAAGDGVFAGDVTQPADLTAAIGTATATAPLRVCVTCAGVGTVGRVIGHDDEAFRRTIEVNLIGTFNTLRAAATAMAGNEPDAEGQRGVIVLTASIAAFEGQIGQIAYSASKGGVAGMVLPAARDLARTGIRVAGIAPGLFDTPLLAGLPEAARLALGASVPNPPRLGHPDEFADLVWAIVRNPMVNGETIRIDGGLRMAPR